MSLPEVVDWRSLPNAPQPGTEVASFDLLPDGGAHFYVCGPADSLFRLVLLRNGGEIRAYVNRCPHFGVVLAQRPEQMILKAGESVSCNVHYARFRWQDGFCEWGDCAGESLIAVPLEVCAGIVRIASE
jgi:nitrite reductase/ring-hydroxylating ferredoxin subunit